MLELAGPFTVMVATLTLAILSPGPAIIAAMQTSFARGRTVAVPYGVGLAVGASVWCLFALAGLTVLFQLVPALYVALKIFGGLYLLWMAWGLWQSAPHPMPEAARTRFGTGFWGGIALNLSNPKPALFYSALIVALFPGPQPLGAQVAIYATALGTELFWYVAITSAMSTAPLRRRYASAKLWLDRGAALLLGLLGLGLLAETARETLIEIA